MACHIEILAVPDNIHLEWHLHLPKPNYRPATVLSIEANSNELAHILNMCRNIPQSTRPVQKWFGDTAKFIAYALK